MSIKSVDKDGTIEYINEKRKYHREDGPAIEFPSGYKAWYINGLRHREDGPAIEFPSGNVEYWLNGGMYSKEDWEEEIIKIKLNRIKDL